VRRLFWLAAGLGAGAVGVIVASRFAKRQVRKVAPTTIARETRDGLLDLSRRVSESIAEGKRAMDEREREIREQLEQDGRRPA
jgi:hypothetical protein